MYTFSWLIIIIIIKNTSFHLALVIFTWYHLRHSQGLWPELKTTHPSKGICNIETRRTWNTAAQNYTLSSHQVKLDLALLKRKMLGREKTKVNHWRVHAAIQEIRWQRKHPGFSVMALMYAIQGGERPATSPIWTFFPHISWTELAYVAPYAIAFYPVMGFHRLNIQYMALDVTG